MAKWEPLKKGLRYVVALQIFANWAGSGYTYARPVGSGRILRFWTLRGAQAYADKLNWLDSPSPKEQV